MTRVFVELPSFQNDWKEMGLTDEDLSRLQKALIDDPAIGDVIQHTGGIRKMRFAFEHRGKSGSSRVIYIDFESYERIYLLAAYPKKEKDNLTTAERNALKKLAEILKNEIERKFGGGQT